MRYALLFPGQGSQQAGMGLALAAAHPAARAALEEADAALGDELRLLDLLRQGSAEELQRTANAQPAILAASVAAFRAFAAVGKPPPTFFAGHSLGEWSALVAAGSLSLADGVRAVRARGRFMQEAVPAGEGAMTAIVGAPFEAVRDACAETEALLPGRTAQPANHNAPDQTVISGHTDAVDTAAAAAKARGARRAVKLQVSAPFHCRLMAPVQPRLAEVLRPLWFRAPSAPLVANVTAQPDADAARIAPLLLEQVTATVRWCDSIRRMVSGGVELFIEMGPGEVLSGLVQRIAPGVRSISVSDPDRLEEALALLA